MAYDAFEKKDFILTAHLVVVGGDTPGVSKMVQLSGHNSKHPCRACRIEGIPLTSTINAKDKHGNEITRNRTQLYYPLIQPQRRKVTIEQFNNAFDEITGKDFKRTPQNYVADGEAAEAMRNDPYLKTNAVMGVKGVAKLSTLRTISFPHSFPFDVMHLLYLGFVRDLLNLISGQYFAQNSPLNFHEGRMSAKDWVALGIDMENARVPGNWGRKPDNIQKYMKSSKAEELGNFAIYFMLPLVYGRVSDTTFRALRRLVYILLALTGYEIEYAEIDFVEEQLRLFLKWFYDTFYKYEEERLSVCKYTLHALVHLVQDVRNWGPSSYFWQFAQVRCREAQSLIVGTVLWCSRS